MTNNQRAMYTGLAMCRNTEVAQRWSRTQVFLLIHSAGISFAFTKTEPTFSFLTVLSLLGIILGGIWFLTNRRTTQWITYWQLRLEAFERAEPEPVEITLFSGSAWDQMKRSWYPFDIIVNALIVVFAFLWSGVLVRVFLI